MLVRFWIAGALATFAVTAGANPVETPPPDPLLARVLANCDPATGMPFGVPPRPASEPRPIVRKAGWLRQPAAEEVARVYPPGARAAGVAGRATLDCTVSKEGWAHDCTVTREQPSGMHFGAAALWMVKSTTFLPQRVDCKAVDGGLMTTQFWFKLS